MISRRQFLLSLAGGIVLGAASLQRPLLGAESIPCVTRVCIVKSNKLGQDGPWEKQLIEQMLNKGVCLLAGVRDISSGWRKFFDPGDMVALKVNPIARHTGSTKPVVCHALAEVIHTTVGIPHDRFVVYDVSQDDLIGAGFTPVRQPGKMQVRASDEYSDVFSHGGVKARISRVITDQCSALVNVPLLKTHKSAGISVSLKNHYGSIPTDIVRNNLYRYHSDGFRNLVHLNMMAPIRNKTRLVVVDALEAQYQGGPGGDPRYKWRFGGLIMGTDPVAVDTVCLALINSKRESNSLEPLVLPYLDWAREEGLGTNCPEEIWISDMVL